MKKKDTNNNRKNSINSIRTLTMKSNTVTRNFSEDKMKKESLKKSRTNKWSMPSLIRNKCWTSLKLNRRESSRKRLSSSCLTLKTDPMKLMPTKQSYKDLLMKKQKDSIRDKMQFGKRKWKLKSSSCMKSMTQERAMSNLNKHSRTLKESKRS